MTRSQNASRQRLGRGLLRRALVPLMVAIAATMTGMATASATPSEPAMPPEAKRAAPQKSAGFVGGWSEKATERRTERFIAAFERKDIETVQAMLHPDVDLAQPMSITGDRDDAQTLEGKESVLEYFRRVFENFTQVRFVDERISVVAGGEKSFVEANGDLVLTDGRPYQNVYVFGVDWQGRKIVAIDEYANAITACQTLGDPRCAVPGPGRE